MPNDDLLAAADGVLDRLESISDGLVEQLTSALQGSTSELEALMAEWRARRDQRQDAFENQAGRLCGAEPSAIREIEELDLAPRVVVELNVGSADKPLWRQYNDLSKGQKATAALLLLLIGDEAPGPLVVDQPEDDLDNAFIFHTIVPSMRTEKRRRQFLFASHDPNIPVLGDAELIAELSTEIVNDDIVGRIGALGSIDVVEVRQALEDNLEGGRAAFERRRRMYGF